MTILIPQVVLIHLKQDIPNSFIQSVCLFFCLHRGAVFPSHENALVSWLLLPLFGSSHYCLPLQLPIGCAFVAVGGLFLPFSLFWRFRLICSKCVAVCVNVCWGKGNMCLSRADTQGCWRTLCTKALTEMLCYKLAYEDTQMSLNLLSGLTFFFLLGTQWPLT